MAESPDLETPPPRRDSDSSGFYEIPLSPLRLEFKQPEPDPGIPKPPPLDHQPIVKKPSLKKKDSANNVFDGVVHMGFLWHYDPYRRAYRKVDWKSREEQSTRSLRYEPVYGANPWKRRFAIIWSDGRFAWYKACKFVLYGINKRTNAELDEVLFIPWRVNAFGPEVVEMLSSEQIGDPYINRKSISEPSSPKLKKVSSQGTIVSVLESATRGLCICSSSSVVSLAVPPSSSATDSNDFNEPTCIVPRNSKQSLLFAIGGHDWDHGDVYCFAAEDKDDLELWRESFAILSHRKVFQKSALDHLLNTPVVITLPRPLRQ